MMKKLLVPVVILLVCAFIITGCGTTSPSPSTPGVTANPPITQSVTPGATTPAATIKPATTTPPASTQATPATAATTAPAATKPSDKYGGTITYIQPTAPGTPFGWPGEAAGTSMLALQISILPLLDEAYNGDLSPLLAASYDVDTSADKPSITFKLKKGVKFHDGSELTAQIVKWNLDNLKTGTLTSSSSAWKSIEVVDDYTVKINLFQWMNSAVRSFGGPAGSMASKAAYDKNGLDYMRWNMVGTGPLKQVSFSRDVSLKFTRFDDFCIPGKPYIQNLTILYVADDMTRLALFKSGGADILSLSTNKSAKEMQDAGYTVLASSGGTRFLLPDSTNKDSVWANPKVRMAAEYAIDKESLNKAFGYGFWEIAYQLPGKDSKAYVPTITGRKYDIAKAKQLLTEAGYPNGFKSVLNCASTADRDVPIAIQAMLKAAGINVEVLFADSAKFTTYQMGTWTGLLLDQITYRANYNAVLSQWFANTSPWYRSMKLPEGYDALLNASLVSPTQDAKLLGKCIQALYDDATIIPIYCPSAITATTDKVHDSGIGEMGSNTIWNAKNVWLSK
jgi:peptide/nickel transport system substrate-binding protein